MDMIGFLCVFVIVSLLMLSHQILPCGTCGRRYRKCQCPNKREELH